LPQIHKKSGEYFLWGLTTTIDAFFCSQSEVHCGVVSVTTTILLSVGKRTFWVNF